MKSLKFYLLIIVLTVFTTQIHGQLTIDGTIADTELNPISDALVEIIDETNTSIVYSDVSDASGYFSISNITDIKGESKLVPANHIVLRNYPNPFNPTTMIYFEIPKPEKIEIKIYDILGRVVRLLHNNYHKAGTYQVIWDGRNNFGAGVSAGIYFCRLKTEDQIKVHKMVLLDGGSKAASISSTTAKKSDFQKLPKIDSKFNFTIRASGDQISTTELNHIVCSGDTTIMLTVPKILKTVTIGVIGGEVELNNFSMSIPEGTFISDTELRIFEALNDEMDDSSNASKIFGVEGIPENFAKPIDISIMPEKELTDESFITVGQDYEIPITNTSEIVYKFMDTQDTLGTLTCKLFPDLATIGRSLSKTISDEYKPHKIYFTSKTGLYSHSSNKKHFEIFQSSNYSWRDAQSLGYMLELNFDIVKSAGFDTNNVDWPAQVYVKELKPALFNRGCEYYLTYGSKNISMLIDHRRLSGISESSMREYAIGILSSYDTDFYLPTEFTGIVNSDRYWFHHAVASWFEEKKVSPVNLPYDPIDYYRYLLVNTDNRIAPFRGMRAGAGNSSLSALNHGGGMSSFIKYIDNNYGEGPIINIYKLIRKNQLHPIEAVKNTLDDPYIWWPDYLEELMEGELYSFDKEKVFAFWDEGNLDNSHEGGRYEFKDKNDTLKLFEDVKFVSLSAKAYEISWNSTEIDCTRTMNISLKNSENSMIVYGVTGTQKYLQLGKGQNYLKNIGELLKVTIDEDPIDRIIVVVANAESEAPYTNYSNINLEVKLDRPAKLELDVNRVHVMVKIGAHFKDSEDLVTTGNFKYQNIEEYALEGTYENKKFAASWNKTLWDGGNATGSIIIQFDTASTPGYLKITDYEIKNTEVRPWDTSGTYTVEKVFSGNNKNIYGYTSDLATVIEVFGLDVCPNRDFVKWDIIYPKSWLKLTDTFCNDESYFRIRLWKEE